MSARRLAKSMTWKRIYTLFHLLNYRTNETRMTLWNDNKHSVRAARIFLFLFCPFPCLLFLLIHFISALDVERWAAQDGLSPFSVCYGIWNMMNRQNNCPTTITKHYSEREKKEWREFEENTRKSGINVKKRQKHIERPKVEESEREGANGLYESRITWSTARREMFESVLKFAFAHHLLQFFCFCFLFRWRLSCWCTHITTSRFIFLCVISRDAERQREAMRCCCQ